MAAKLTVHNAEIKTASVEVKTLTISGKQVTLAVFRQLREEPLVNDDGTLNGVPWGTVNYHPDKCADRSEHCHVVWQRGNDLLRSAVAVNPVFGDFKSATANCYLMACVKEHLAGGTLHFNNQPLTVERNRPDGAEIPALWRAITLSGIRVVMSVSVDARDAVQYQGELVRYRERMQQDGRSYDLPRIERNLDGAATEFNFQLEQHGITQTADDLYEVLKDECRAEAERRQRHAQARRAIADLPQLFIAV